MRIQLDHFYRGEPSHGQSIAPGEYEESDESLFGLASYLVENGHAVVVEAQDVLTVSADELTEDAPTPKGKRK